MLVVLAWLAGLTGLVGLAGLAGLAELGPKWGDSDLGKKVLKDDGFMMGTDHRKIGCDFKVFVQCDFGAFVMLCWLCWLGSLC